MDIDQDKVPATLQEAVDIIVASLSDEEKAELKKLKTNSAKLHFPVGRYLRNNWDLWSRDTPLGLWFLNIGITHGDDKSGIIIESAIRTIQGLPLELEEQVKRYHQHWMETIGRAIP